MTLLAPAEGRRRPDGSGQPLGGLCVLRATSSSPRTVETPLTPNDTYANSTTTSEMITLEFHEIRQSDKVVLVSPSHREGGPAVAKAVRDIESKDA